ncbi:hypothetical protein ASG37_10415 [Sphingomonas sp. Leaf407]|uniref:hypothetical protein n=1 Tax=unclassified Sphingomonas TaxID=196159 RepID=UPI0006F531DC|nr:MULTISPECIES: hypothetical protein [unclassified Sphingomonas]KQN37454.1 hypothetical protein ASE97_07705 [Sphingomonas sp. Leaf42]KQT27822.1 hypothetical protein ASG37_10415 [Sphingomonas sp. Leaf407]
MSRRLSAGFIVSLFAAASAQAQDFGKTLCAQAGNAGRIDVKAVRDKALEGVPLSLLDANNDDTISPEEKIAALTEKTFCDIRKCSVAEGKAVLQARNRISDVWGAHFERRDTFTGLDCGPPAASLATPLAAKETVGDQLRTPPLLMGKDIDSLSVQRGADRDRSALQKVAPAEIGVEVDRVKNTRTVAIDAVLGWRAVDTESITLIPFVQYVRSNVRDREAGTDDRSGKLGLGIVGNGFIGNEQFAFAPRYARDLVDRSELLSVRMTWRPGFLYKLDTFQRALPFACSERGKGGNCRPGTGLGLWTDFQLVSAFGTVLREGADPLLTRGREFVRVGPSASAHLFGNEGLFRDLSLNVFYKHLFRLSGDGTAIEDVRVDVNYWIAGSPNVSLVYGYERSRDEETLKRTDLWRLGLGVRF